MTKFRYGPALALAMALDGCATSLPPEPSFEQWEAAQTRSFRVDEATFRRAVATVFASSRPGEFKVRPIAGGIEANRSWYYSTPEFLILGVAGYSGHETWTISYTIQAGLLTATATENAASKEQSIYAMPDGQFQPPTPAQYELFWNRLNYVLGLAPNWETCAAFKASFDRRYRKYAVSADTNWGLCGYKDSERQPAVIAAK